MINILFKNTYLTILKEFNIFVISFGIIDISSKKVCSQKITLVDVPLTARQSIMSN